MSKKPVRVAVTGAAGQIGYALLFRIASGEMLGKDQPVILQLLEIPDEKAQNALKGVIMELEDCAFPLLAGIEAHSDPMTAFKDTDYALLVGARPRGPGMERADLLAANAQIFTAQGKALNAVASRNVRVLVVGNPANTNAYIAMKSAPDLPAKNFTAMLRLDHNRAASQIAAKIGCAVGDIEKLAVWGNHSPTMYADYRFATVNGKSVKDTINDHDWNANTFLPTVGKRGAAIIAARGLSSAASAANAASPSLLPGLRAGRLTPHRSALPILVRPPRTRCWPRCAPACGGSMAFRARENSAYRRCIPPSRCATPTRAAVATQTQAPPRRQPA